MIRITRDNLHYKFDKEIKHVAKASSKDTLVFECVDCYNNQINSDSIDFKSVNMKLNNPATGPVFISDAKKGDILKVTIKDIKLDNKGVMALRPQSGLFGDLVKETSKVVPVKNNIAKFNNIDIPLRPMIGVIGVAPIEPILTTIPGEHGGNLDVKDLGVDSIIYLPVNVDGALLSLGDLHGIQGDGEVAICALEMDGVVKLEVEVLKNRNIPTPFIITKDKYLAISSAKSLDQATKEAGDKMLNFLKNNSELSLEECVMLLSLLGNSRISQVVNSLKGAIMEFPVSLINETFEI